VAEDAKTEILVERMTKARLSATTKLKRDRL
jgi:hypothetical protein